MLIPLRGDDTLCSVWVCSLKLNQLAAVMINDLHKQRRYAVATRFFAIVIPLGVILAAGILVHYYTERKLTQSNQNINEKSQVALIQKGIMGEMRSVIADLTFLAKINELWDILDAKDSSFEYERARGLAAQEFLYFSEKKGVYDQITFLDDYGDEIIRINYGDGHPYIVEQSQLANFVTQPYFRNSLSQELGGVYISSFDFEIVAHDSQEIKHSVIRFATPLFDSYGNKRGILMLNFRGAKLIWGFAQAAYDIIDHAHLLNDEGEWLYDPDEPMEDASFFKGGESFAQKYPGPWQKIIQNDKGSFETSEGLFTFDTIYPAVSVLELYSKSGVDAISSIKEESSDPIAWKVVSLLTPDMRGVSLLEFFKKNLLLYLSMMLFIVAGSLVLAQTSVKKRLAQAHADYDRRFRRTLQNIQLCAVMLDAVGKVVFCNQRLLELLGYSQEEILGADWFELCVPREQRDEALQSFSDMLAEKAPPRISETSILSKHGVSHVISWNNMFSINSSGELNGLICIGQDITEQKANEQQLHKLSRAVGQTQESIVITDVNGVMEYVNPGFTKLTGYTADEALGHTWDIFKHDSSDSDLRHAILTGEEWRGTLHSQRKNGEPYWENVVISPIRDEQGVMTHFLVIREDVTEQKKLREEVEQRNIELARTQSLATMGRMATTIAHDLRNPLSSIKMTLQILKKHAVGVLENGGAELPGIALDQVRYMEDILADLLLYSSPDALKPDWLSMNKLLDTAISSSQKTISDYNVNVRTEYQQQLPTIHVDATKLRQVFCNLIVNAAQATAGTGRPAEIVIHTRLELTIKEPLIYVEISDNGSGFDSETLDNLFEPFYTTRAKGTGLGLSIVKRFVELHHGTIHVENNEQGGGKVMLHFPIRPLD